MISKKIMFILIAVFAVSCIFPSEYAYGTQPTNAIGDEGSSSSDFTITLSQTTYTFDAKEKTPDVTVQDENGEIVPSSEYDYFYEDNWAAGTASVIVYYKDNEKTATFTIKRRSISTVPVKYKKSFVYNGKYIHPELTVGDQSNWLSAGDDYKISYLNNKMPGTAKMTIKGVGNYCGTITYTFTIKAREVKFFHCNTDLSYDWSYTGKYIKPKLSLGYQRNGFYEDVLRGKDYTIKYSNNKKVGRANIIVIGKGGYTGKKVLHFKIIPRIVTGIKLKAEKGKKVRVSWKKAKGAKRYRITWFYSNFGLENTKCAPPIDAGTEHKATTGKRSFTIKKPTNKADKKKKYVWIFVNGYKKVSGKAYHGNIRGFRSVRLKRK